MATQFQYGGVNQPRPGSIDEELMLRRRQREIDMELAAKEQLANLDQQNALGLITAKEQAGIDTAVQKRRLGLGTLQEQLANPNSEMYAYDGPAAAVSVGNELGPLNAPPPVATPTPRLGLSPLGAAAVDASRSGNSLTLDEYRKRKEADVDAGKELAVTKSDLAAQAKALEAQLRLVQEQMQLQAKDLSADIPMVTNDANTSTAQVLQQYGVVPGQKPIQAPAFSEQKPIQAPAFSDEDPLSGFSPEDQATIKDNMELFPNQDPQRIIELLRAKKLING